MIIHRRAAALFFAFAGLNALGWPVAAKAGEPAPLIAAASDLQFALSDIAMAYQSATGKMVRITFGSSGNFSQQIRQRAPFELFFSADEALIAGLAQDGLTQDEGTQYGLGRIVLFVPTGSPLKADGTLADLKAALTDGRLRKLAIANPEHAPYGRRAMEALTHAGLANAITDKLVLGENVSQAAQFSTSGNAEAGIIAYALARSSKVAAAGSFALIPEDWHTPLRQRMVLLKGASSEASAFYAFMQTPTARKIMRGYGFALPGENS
jgi:molybdate transport system substrate-binding protein